MLTIEAKLKLALHDALLKMGQDIPEDKIVIERSKEKVHGDYATNVALQSARLFRKAPAVIAKEISENLDLDIIEKMEVAGPGFLNFFIKQDSLSTLIKTVLDKGDDYGRSNVGNGEKINVEFVSANPTGDLHLGHTRGAALGDSICRMYSFIGYDVTREFYVNDAGNQITNLAKSLFVRYHEAFGDNSLSLPEDGYYGEDVKNIAAQIKDEEGDKYLTWNDETFEFLKKRGTELELAKLNRDLTMFRVDFDIFSSELEIRRAGLIEKVLEVMKPYIYEEEGATFLRTTAFSDDKDRVIVKSDGSYTYLLPDIAYHFDKLQRGFKLLVDCLGADHHGYINRMKSSLQMLGYSPDILEIELIQMVRLFKDGKEYKMSKRTGNAVSMRELCEEVGVDAVRYFFVSRAGSSHLDFDLDLVAKMDSSNPVFYAQYAHARLSKVLEQNADIEIDIAGKHLTSETEKGLLKVMEDFPKEVISAALARAPYKLTNYIQKLAASIHEFYTVCRIADRENVEVTASRLALASAAKQVMKNALNLIGVSAPSRM